MHVHIIGRPATRQGRRGSFPAPPPPLWRRASRERTADAPHVASSLGLCTLPAPPLTLPGLSALDPGSKHHPPFQSHHTEWCPRMAPPYSQLRYTGPGRSSFSRSFSSWLSSSSRASFLLTLPTVSSFVMWHMRWYLAFVASHLRLSDRTRSLRSSSEKGSSCSPSANPAGSCWRPISATYASIISFSRRISSFTCSRYAGDLP